MAQVQIDEAKFRDIFENPTIARMYNEIGDTEFEDFITYVFRQAGFGAQGVGNLHIRGNDVKLYADPGVHHVEGGCASLIVTGDSASDTCSSRHSGFPG
jgi:hypothetical protein